MHVKGMVQVAGVTYRIVRIERGQYDVVRILTTSAWVSSERFLALSHRSFGSRPTPWPRLPRLPVKWARRAGSRLSFA